MLIVVLPVPLGHWITNTVKVNNVTFTSFDAGDQINDEYPFVCKRSRIDRDATGSAEALLADQTRELPPRLSRPQAHPVCTEIQPTLPTRTALSARRRVVSIAGLEPTINVPSPAFRTFVCSDTGRFVLRMWPAPGHSCQAATTIPIVCPAGTHCVRGSPAPTPCLPGTYGTEAGLTTQDDCIDSEPGYWAFGGERTPCPIGTFNPETNANSSKACLECPPHATTYATAATSIAQCVCDIGYYDGRYKADALIHGRRHGRQNATATAANTTYAADADLANASSVDGAICVNCVVGVSCTAKGATLARLPLKVGYFRLTAFSHDVHRCPDATFNCTSPELTTQCQSQSTTGCRGGEDASASCSPGLTGPYCMLCAKGNATEYYSAASDSEKAHCNSCDHISLSGSTVTGLVTLSAGLLLIGFCYLALERQKRLRYLIFIAWRQVAVKLKLVVSFFLIAVKVGKVYQVELPPDVRALLSRLELPLSLGFDLVGTIFECAHMGSYVDKMAGWILLPPLLILVLISVVAINLACHGRCSRGALFDAAAPWVLRGLFLLYPTITNLAFQAWPCVSFDDERSFLIADLSIECGGGRHLEAQAWAWVAMIIYPVGLIVGCGVLLFLAREAISSQMPSRLSNATAFLHAEYKPAHYYWELFEMAR